MPDADRTAEWLQNARIHQESAEHALKVKDIDHWCLAAIANVDSPRLLAAVEAVLKLTGDWDEKAAELDGMAERADARGADSSRTILMSTRAQAHNDCAQALREAITRELAAMAGEDGES